MRLIVYYFSATGNTGRGCDMLSEACAANGITCVLRNIESSGTEEFCNLCAGDILCFAFPVYASNIPPVMSSFIKSLSARISHGEVMRYAVVTTFGFADGCGPYEVGKLLGKRRAELVGYEGVRIASNTPTRHQITSQRLQGRFEKADRKIKSFVGDMAAGKEHIAAGVYPMAFSRGIASKILESAYTHLSIDPQRCVRCMKCVNSCPTGSIIAGENSALAILPSCTGCMRCFNLCPTCAVLHDGKYLPPEKYARYKL